MQSNGKSETCLPAPSGSVAGDLLLEAWREALADVLDTERRQWQRERALIEAQAAAVTAQATAVIASLKAEATELRQLVTEQINARLSEIRSGADGAPGPAGPPGAKGEPGDPGAKGDQGDKGEAGDKGEPGDKGDPGAKGEPGDPGAKGDQGNKGEAGEPGAKGEPGIQGERGEDGRQGEKGEEGRQGEQGPPGAQGEPGKAGTPGQLKGARPYAEGAVHYEGDIILHQGGTYQARCDTARAPPHEDWACIAAKGRDAAMPKVAATYREGETYSFLTIVALNGSSFIARTDDPGPCPGDGWQLIASAGRPGKHGPKGEPGEAGSRGERGLPGEKAPTILGWQVDREAYAATPIMSDDSEVPPLELRSLFEQFHTEAR
jgi:hypothetical protein